MFVILYRLIPQFYAVALFHPDYIKGRRPRYTSRSLIRHGKHVRHILLYNSASPSETELYDLVEDCLSWCPNLHNVAMWTIEPRPGAFKNVLDQLVNLPHLTHLSIELGALSSVISRRPTIPIFRRATHLELLKLGRLPNPRIIDESFPVLTHLSLDGLMLITEHIEAALYHWKDRLQVIVWFVGVSGIDCLPEVMATSMYAPLSDPRVVRLTYGNHYAKTWYEGVEGGMGIWRTAEETVQRRRQTGVLRSES